MCGIVGYVGSRPALPILIGGLQRLEYRGYDSAGVAVSVDHSLFVEKCAGRIETLARRLANRTVCSGPAGIGHTRWATHGRPNADNAHPHFSCDRRIAVVHNGIVENHAELRAELTRSGHAFSSATDTEVIVHLIESCYRGDPLAAVAAALPRLRGSYALGILFADHPGVLIGARRSSPLIIGVNGGECFLASDIPAILPHARDFRLLEDGQIAVLRRDGLQVFSADLRPQEPRPYVFAHDYAEAEKRGYPTFMLKEIHEAPEVIRRELAGRLDGAFEELRIPEARLAAARHVVLTACGTAWHAALYAKYVLEQVAGRRADCWLASELRYSPPPIDRDTLFVAISQSGETADTIQALRIARERGALTVAVTNTPSSSIAREAEGAVYNRAGVESGVAATKTYLAQLASMLLLAIKVGGRRDLVEPLRQIPEQIEEILQDDSRVRECAERFRDGYSFMFLGRRFNVPTAYEGALKMKEISYRHAEGYAAGEMKHGPLALVDEHLAAVAIAPRGETYEKMASNVEEVRSRGGKIIAVVTKGETLGGEAAAAFEIGQTPEVLSPFLAVVPLQLLAYHTATMLGRDVDRPRNLAKSVTVE